MKYLIICLSWIIAFSAIQAQIVSPVFRNYTLKDGLNSNLLSTIFEDKKGYLWVATVNGLLTYDGKEFIQVASNSYAKFNLGQTHEEQIWINGGKNITLFQDQQSFTYPFQQDFADLTTGTYIKSSIADSSGSIWFSVANVDVKNDPFQRLTTLYQMTQDGIIAHDLTKDPEAKRLGKNCYWKDIGDQVAYTGRSKILGIFPERKQILGSQPFDPNVFQYPINRMIKLRDGSYIASSTNNLIHFDDSLIYFYGTHFLPKHHQIIDLYEDLQGSVWLSTFRGVYCVDDQNFLEIDKYKHYLPDQTITKTLQSKDGSYWFASRTGGLFQMTSQHSNWIRWAERGKKNVYLAPFIEKDSIWFSSYDGHIYLMDSSYKMTAIDLPRHQTATYFTKFGDHLLTSTRWLLSPEGSMFLDTLEGETQQMISFSQLKNGKKGRVWVASNSGGVYEIDIPQRKIVYDSKEYGYRDFASSLEISPDQSVWTLSKSGVWKLNDSIFYRPYKEFKELEQIEKKWPLDFISILDEQTILLHSLDSGVAIVQKNQIQLLRKGKELESFGRTYLSVESKDIFWVLTNNSFDRFTWDQERRAFVKSGSFDPGFAIPLAAEFRGAFFANGQLWIFIDQGLICFDPQHILTQQTHYPPVYITGLEANGLLHTPEHPIKLSHFENRVILNYKTIAYQNQDRIQTRYRLVGSDEPWQYTRDTRIRYTHLKPGDYTFEVESSNGNGEFRNQVQQLHFEIQPHITQTLWFRILASLTVISLVLAGMFGYIRYTTQQNQQRRIITELRYQSLINQMNPHFIFNAMNSIAFMIRNQENRKANHYLAQFAGLLRGVLENAHDSFVSLEEEMEQIQQYVDLEQLQMGDALELDIDIDPDLELSALYVPPMLLQPFIENAIKHGIAPNGGGELMIHVLDAEDRILVAIRDDGIGREASKAIKKTYISKKGRSVGLSNTAERIDSLNRLYQIDVQVRVEDLMEDDQAVGTQVEFSFPKLSHIPRISFVKSSTQNHFNT